MSHSFLDGGCGKLLTDDFYNGSRFDGGLGRYAPEILQGDSRLAILLLRRNAPIYLAESARPDFGGAKSIVQLRRWEIISRYTVQLTAQRFSNLTFIFCVIPYVSRPDNMIPNKKTRAAVHLRCGNIICSRMAVTADTSET